MFLSSKFLVATSNPYEKIATLSSYENVLEQALDSNYISDKELVTLSDWRRNPSEWRQ